MEKVRINKFLASNGVASRREIDNMIKKGQIKINGKIPTSGERINNDDVIEINNKILNIEDKKEKVYFLLNKPLKVLSSVSDDRGRKTVVDMIETKERIYPIGRLDYETEGAILLTNDGDLFNKVIHPRTEIYKEYEVTVKGAITDKAITILKYGVELEDGITLPALVKIKEREDTFTKIILSIREGRNRQIRRMISAVGYRVEKLKRNKIGEIDISGLRSGEYRSLTEEEIKYLYSMGEVKRK
jgi:23S rRNA pseudouridine2605 synthase